MDGKISQVTLVVSNKVKSLAFYTEKVGFEKKTDVTGPGGYRYVTVGLKGQDVEMPLFEVGSAADPTTMEWSKKWTPGMAPPIVILVADCRKVHKELSGRGVDFPQPPMDHPWGTVATFKDLDGNLFSLSQLKGDWPKR
jgi:predicted enzyme related to lactoylglutathione lyase